MGLRKSIEKYYQNRLYAINAAKNVGIVENLCPDYDWTGTIFHINDGIVVALVRETDENGMVKRSINWHDFNTSKNKPKNLKHGDLIIVRHDEPIKIIKN